MVKEPSPGTKQSMCTRCHEVFSTPANFDRHHIPTSRKPTGPLTTCIDPATVGLALNRFGVWVMSDDDHLYTGPT